MTEKNPTLQKSKSVPRGLATLKCTSATAICMTGNDGFLLPYVILPPYDRAFRSLTLSTVAGVKLLLVFIVS